MKINRFLLSLFMLLSIACTPISFASGLVPNTSGDIGSGDIGSGDVGSGDVGSGDVGSGDVGSGDVGSGDTTSGDITSGDITIGDDEKVLSSIAKNSTFEIVKNTKLSAAFEVEVASGETFAYAITVQPNHGVVEQSGDNSANYIYTPEKDYHGTDTFSFRLESGDAYSNSATVTIKVTEDKTDVIPFNYIDMKTHWANYSASHLAARGLIIGEEIGNRYYFNPNKTMTRGEFMLFLLSITESNVDANVDVSKVTFADSDTLPDWLLEAAKVAYSRGIIKGSSDNGKIYLNLNRNITRVEAAVMISNVLDDKSSTKEIKYTDNNLIPSWATQAVKNLSAYQIIQGDSTGTFRPTSILTRAEGAELSFKLLKQLELNSLNGSGDLK